MRLRSPRCENIFLIHDALRLGAGADEICDATGIDPWFLDQLAQLVEHENELRARAAAGRRLRGVERLMNFSCGKGVKNKL